MRSYSRSRAGSACPTYTRRRYRASRIVAFSDCARRSASFGSLIRRRLEQGDVDSLGPLVAGLGVVGDLGPLGERLEAVAADAAVVDEQILAAVVGRDEAEALVVVEPLHGSGRHDDASCVGELRTRETHCGDDGGR